MKEMFPGIENKAELKLPDYVDGYGELTRQPGLAGNFIPALKAPGIPNLYFASDTYLERSLAINGAALSGIKCLDQIIKDLKK